MAGRYAKTVRNVTADAVAHAVDALPFLERLFRAVGPHVQTRPIAEAFHRRTRQTLSELWRREGTRFRPVTVGGLTILMDVTDFTCHHLYFHGATYEPATVQCLVERLGPGQTFVDVGANHGYFSVLAARLVGPAGRVFAFEPHPSVVEQLSEHLTCNGLTNVAIERIALADAEGPLDLFVSACAANSGLSSITPESPAFASGSLDRDRRVQVPATTFDRWRQARGVDRVDLMKIDVEGAEALVLRGMTETLAKAPPAGIICESHGLGGTHQDEARRMLVANGYQPVDLDVDETRRIALYTKRIDRA
jgi:FkbM family methyltransferase